MSAVSDQFTVFYKGTFKVSDVALTQFSTCTRSLDIIHTLVFNRHFLFQKA